ncbi:hypothetical protein RQP53_18410 [Paucibacter sp. APW11]|uniref:Oligosaccharide repeat unit polymerase n=1 Tax=Roseateles aquae TaxID=3077235 RepID=A0ABU3PGL6_9BURK|nr:hypothetical protein [Paucibacter sp. APW11]MDT9001258.1 hypothetical protein [Paucibacter sp. APW11]
MELLFTLNLLLGIGSIFWPVWFSRSQLALPWVNPFTISLAVSLPVQLMKLLGGPLVLIDGGLFDVDYQLALLMGTLLIAAQTLGLVFFLRLFGQIRIERYLPFQRLHLGSSGLWRAAAATLLAFAVFFVLLATAEFGLGNWLGNPREGYQLYRTGQGHWYAMALSTLSASYLLTLLARPKPTTAIACSLFYALLSYFLGSKGTLLAFFVTGLVFLWFLKWKHLVRVFLIGTPLLFSALVYNLFLALGDGFDFQAILEYFDYYKNAADYYHAHLAGQLPLFWGEISLSSLWAYAPRALFPDKPVVYGILLVNEFFYPGQAELTNTPAFGGAVEQYADFGLPGVIFFGFFSAQSVLTAMMSHLIFKRPGIGLNSVSGATVLLMLIQFAPAFGSYFPGWLFLALVLVIMLIVRIAAARYRWLQQPGSLA